MGYEIGDEWGTFLVLGWLLSPLIFIVGAATALTLANLWHRVRLKRRAEVERAADTPRRGYAMQHDRVHRASVS